MPKLALGHVLTTVGTRNEDMSVADFELDILEAIASGLDGFLFNWGTFTSGNQANVANFVTALSNLGAPAANFMFAPSVDGTPTEADIRLWFDTYYDHPNHVLLDGDPVLVAWEVLSVGNTFFVDLKTTLEVTDSHPVKFVPWLACSLITMTDRFTDWTSLDGFYPWVVGKSGEETDFNTTAQSLSTTHSKSYWGSVSFDMCALNKSATYRNRLAGEGITTQMTPFVDATLTTDYLVVATWNDYGEDHHINTYPAPQAFPKNAASDALAWSHAGYARVLKHYLDWWRTGTEPTITDDVICVFHMRQLGLGGTPPYTYATYAPDKGSDIVHVTTLTKAAATLEVTSGTESVSSTAVSAGVDHHQFTAAAGSQRYELLRGNDLVLRGQTHETIDDPPTQDWSWSRYTEVITARDVRSQPIRRPDDVVARNVRATFLA